MQLFWDPNSLTLDSCSQHGLATAWLMSEWMDNVILFQNHALLIFGFPGCRVILFHSSVRQWFENKEKVVNIILVVQTSVGQMSMLAQLTSELWKNCMWWVENLFKDELGMLIQSSPRNKPVLDILRDIYGYHLSDMVGDNTLRIWCLMSCLILQMSK